MVNLLTETVEKIRANGKTEADIQWISIYITENHQVFTTWEQFKSVIKNINYDNGYGEHEVDLSLTVSGNGWWLKRRQYDGKEWWEYCTVPQQPKIFKALTTKDIIDNGVP